MDRLIRPASEYVKVTGQKPEYLAKTIAAALNFVNEDDDEAVKLQQMIQEKGYEQTLQTVSGLDSDHPLHAAVMEELENIKQLRDAVK